MWRSDLLTPEDAPLQDTAKAGFVPQPIDARIFLAMAQPLIQNRIWSSTHRCQFKWLPLILVDLSLPFWNYLRPESGTSPWTEGCQTGHQSHCSFPHTKEKCTVIRKNQSNPRIQKHFFFLPFNFNELQHCKFLLFCYIVSSQLPTEWRVSLSASYAPLKSDM